MKFIKKILSVGAIVFTANPSAYCFIEESDPFSRPSQVQENLVDALENDRSGNVSEESLESSLSVSLIRDALLEEAFRTAQALEPGITSEEPFSRRQYFGNYSEFQRASEDFKYARIDENLNTGLVLIGITGMYFLAVLLTDTSRLFNLENILVVWCGVYGALKIISACGEKQSLEENKLFLFENQD